jgi:hypothetical protein
MPSAHDLRLRDYKSTRPARPPRLSFGDFRRLQLRARHNKYFFVLCLAGVARGSLRMKTNARPQQEPLEDEV